ncbi:hypothetical protein TNCV_125091 [Trichonephila clavipes]|nr:hypothetical protein TNCV_125091 [Trichonephila clavipes]
MIPRTITPAVGVVCRYKARTGLRETFTKEPPHMNTLVIAAEIESRFMPEDRPAFLFRRMPKAQKVGGEKN